MQYRVASYALVWHEQLSPQFTHLHNWALQHTHRCLVNPRAKASSGLAPRPRAADSCHDDYADDVRPARRAWMKEKVNPWACSVIFLLGGRADQLVLR